MDVKVFQLSNSNINEERISLEHLLYYVRNKILQLGSITLQNLNLDKHADYNSTVDSMLQNAFNVVQQLAAHIDEDIYNKNKVMAKQTSKYQIYDRYERLILWDGGFFINDTSKVDINSNSQIRKLLMYPKKLNMTISHNLRNFYKTYYEDIYINKYEQAQNDCFI